MSDRSPAASSAASLAGRIQATRELLAIDYRLSNDGREPIYVWDVMVGHGEKGQVVDPDTAYVFWEAPETVRIVRAVLPLPPDFEVAKKEVPYVRKVLPGGSVTGRIALPLPLREYSPFYPPAEKYRDVVCRKTRLQIGWTAEQSGMTVQPRVVGGEKVLALRGSWKGPVQFVASGVFDGSVVLQVREDGFDRRPPMS
jgi:hypothetical protein